MSRKKVKLQWIANNGARKATYKKRVNGLIKKVGELSVLCGVDACLIAYSRYHLQPEVWPSAAEAERVVAAFKRRPETDHTKKVLNQEIFISQRIMKAKDYLVREMKKNRKKEIENLKTQCLGGMLVGGLERKDVLDMIWAIDDHLEAVNKRIAVGPWLQAAAEARGKACDTGAGIGDIPTVGAFTSIHAASSDVPVSLVGARDAGDAAAAADQVNMDDFFDFTVDNLSNPLLPTEQNINENMGNASGDPLACDFSDFWLNPHVF